MKDLIQKISQMTDLDELRSLNQVVIGRCRQIDELKQASIRAQFRIGDKVEWDGKRGAQTGTIEKINRKNIVVKTDQCMWNVTPSILRKAA